MNTLTLHGLLHGGTVTFNTYEAYKDHLKDSRIIVYINGNRTENLFHGLYELHSHNVRDWFDMLKQYKALKLEERAAVRWLMDTASGYHNMTQALELAPTVKIYKGREIDYVIHFVDDTFNMAHKLGFLKKYFDYSAYCFDLQLQRKIDKVHFENCCYTITNADNFNVWEK